MKSSEDRIIEAIQTAEQFVKIMQEQNENAPMNDFPKVEVFLKTNKKAHLLVEKLVDDKNYPQQSKPTKSEIDKLLLSLNKKDISHRRVKLLFQVSVSVAAAIAVLSFFIWRGELIEDIDSQSLTPINQPTIILSSGENVHVKSDKLIKVVDYKKEVIGATSEVQYNTFVVPHKYIKEVLLEDGTKVTLNANSELKYPTKFSDEKREVFLTGEAFFEVEKNGTPFIVSTQDTKIKVYGTKFNVNTMHDNFTQAVLLSGSIGVTAGKNEEVMIKPNQLFSFNRMEEKYEVKEIEPSIHLTWMGDYIGCQKQSIGLFLEKITNWYGVDFTVSKEVDMKMNVTISLSKQLSIDDFLSIVESSVDLIFIKENNNKYTIKKKGANIKQIY